jgi:hypothetical protein
MPTYANAREFLREVEAHYRSLPGYSDSGLSRSLGLRRPRLCTFETAYRAPGLFRFSFSSSHPYKPLRNLVTRDVIGTDGLKPYFYSRSYGGEEEIEVPESLEMAVAGATGISSGTAHTIGALLFQEVGGFRLLDLRKIRFRPRREIDGVPCIAVTGLHPFGGRTTAWFGSEDLLLRRLVRSRFKSEELRFDPKPFCSDSDDMFDAPRIDA